MIWLRFLAWLVCGVYATIPAFWLVIHPFAEHWRNARNRYSVLAPMWMAMWFVAWWATAQWSQRTLYEHSWTWAITLTLFYVSWQMYSGGVRGLSLDLLIGRHELEPDDHEQALVVTGVHGLVRHPVYLGHLCSMLGWSIGAGTVACFVLTAFAIVTGAVMIPLEERELRQRFGDEYDRYSSQVPMIIPTRL
jgi:protein-S-isoprenylcysteine O-methyltransferase Ste14